MDAILEQLPAFFSAGNITLLAEAVGVTVALTFFGCGLGFLFAFLIVMARQTPGRWAIPLRGGGDPVRRAVPARALPGHVLSGAVRHRHRHQERARSSSWSWSPSRSTRPPTPPTSSAAASNRFRGSEIEAAQTLNFGRWRTMLYVVIPQSWPVILPPLIIFMVAFVKDTSLVGYLGVFELAFRGQRAQQPGLFRHPGVRRRSPCSISACPILSCASVTGWRNGLPHLEVKNLSASYGNLAVLHGVNLSFEKGEVMALIGPSGSGKSTVLRVLMGLTNCSGGTAVLDGKPIDYQLGGERARRARPHGDRVPAIQSVPEHGRDAQRHHRADQDQAPPQGRSRGGSDQDPGRGSAWPRRTVPIPTSFPVASSSASRIARALALKPEILLLDEVTSALDPELVNEVLDTIRGLARDGMTMLLVSHEMAFVREVASKVVMMDKGRVVEVGSPARSSTTRRATAPGSSSARSCGTEADVSGRATNSARYRSRAACPNQLRGDQRGDRPGGESGPGEEVEEEALVTRRLADDRLPVFPVPSTIAAQLRTRSAWPDDRHDQSWRSRDCPSWS